MELPGEEIRIRLHDINYPEIQLKECIVRRFNSPFESQYRSYMYHILDYMDKIIALNERENKLKNAMINKCKKK